MKRTVFMKKGTSKFSGVKEFLNKRGFYIVLFLCIAIIAVTGIYVAKINMDYYSQNTIIDEGAAVVEGPDDGDLPEDPVSKEPVPEEPVPEEPLPEEITPDLDAPTQPTFNEENPIIVKQPIKTEVPTKTNENNKETQTEKIKKVDKLYLPVDGDVILEYASDQLVYSKTLEQWCTHKGIDIRSDRGTPVKAAATGTIEKIYTDNQLGITIIIDHGSGMKTKYCNLSTDDMVKEKQKVKQGDIISGVGNTASFEIGDESHLHFEVIKDGENIDPKTLLP